MAYYDTYLLYANDKLLVKFISEFTRHNLVVCNYYTGTANIVILCEWTSR